MAFFSIKAFYCHRKSTQDLHGITEALISHRKIHIRQTISTDISDFDFDDIKKSIDYYSLGFASVFANNLFLIRNHFRYLFYHFRRVWLLYGLDQIKYHQHAALVCSAIK